MKDRSNLKPLSLLQGLMLVSLVSIFLKYPIFPSVLSGDFSQHLNAAMNVSVGSFPPLSNIVLYYGVEFFLGSALRLSYLPTLETVRLAMGLIVFASPLVVYFSTKALLGSRAAVWSAAVYVLSGFVWFGMVFDSGLWPNFWGLLSSLMLIAATVSFTRKKAGVQGLLFLLAMSNSLLSHYSVLLVWPPLMLYLSMKKDYIGLASFFVPLFVGLALFPDLASVLPGFLAGGGSGPQPTFLSSLIPLPTLSYMVAEMSGNWLGDLASVAVLAGGLYFLTETWKQRDVEMMVISLWFLSCVLFPVYSPGAWRFAFVGLMPLTLMAGWTISKVRPRRFVPRNGRVWLLAFLFLAPVFGSWSNFSFYDATSSTSQTASQQQADYRAIQWIIHDLPSNCNFINSTKCGIITANDENFLYLPYFDLRRYVPSFGGFAVYDAPLSGVIYTQALQTQLFASQHGKYIEVSRLGTDSPGACDPNQSYGLTMTANATEVSPGQHVLLTFSGSSGLNATVRLYDNYTLGEQVGLVDGQAEVLATYIHPGFHRLYLTLGSTSTRPMNVTVGSEASPHPKAVSVPSDYCQPWWGYNPSTMRGWSVIYDDGQVRLYEAPN